MSPGEKLRFDLESRDLLIKCKAQLEEFKLLCGLRIPQVEKEERPDWEAKRVTVSEVIEQITKHLKK